MHVCVCVAGVLISIWDAQLSLRHTPILITLLTVLAQALDVGNAAAVHGPSLCMPGGASKVSAH